MGTETMNIFDSLRSYAGKWNVVDARPMSEEEKSSVKSFHAVEGDYGTSLCFLMMHGDMHFIPVSRDADLSKVDEIGLDDIKLITLKKGDDEITRVEF